MSQPQPVPGVNVRPPLRQPGPGEVIVGYELYEPETGCCKCDGMTSGGMISVLVLVLLFWPAAFIPCCMHDCFEKQQRPIYGPPGSGQAGGYAQQQQGYPADNQGSYPPQNQGGQAYPTKQV